MLRSIWHYRGFIFSSIRHEFRLRFVRSKLGGLWIIISPLAQIAIYAIVLSSVLSAKLQGVENTHAYAIYLITGIFAWSFFSEIMSRCLTVYLDNANLIKKIRFPKSALPIIILGGSLMNSLFLFMAVVVIYMIMGHYPDIHYWALIPVTLVMMLFAMGVGLILGVLNVFIRDISQIFPILLQLGFWLTPIIYPINILPESVQYLVQFNPLFHLMDSYHQIMVYQAYPDWQSLGVMLLISLGLLALAMTLVRRSGPQMVDVL
ncbi:O-antigen export system permease protein RfbD [Methylophaga frappieri]|uniref:Transport permease protein n=1 Tax=Methylophaga frappieri (strain ATCC BAA-2434 / DSM 25690 / JAM7) TaxID=754477 RepID=I1YKI6_METFJ|nr:ABC transporter permease [Methylophaga frappieri]AFJ03429.1 O-antigen export system permease protein RfbD [Methylophaga frappieri]